MNSETQNLSLDLIGIAEATDKSSLAGDYLRHYEQMFSHLRNEAFNLIEIGVFHGASVRLWQRFFSAATIIGVDIDPSCRAYAADRVKIEIGSQADPEFLHRLSGSYPPLVIIDDGSHRSDHIIFTFERLFPTLLPGGYYIIEDLHFHLNESEAERLRGISPILATDYFCGLAKDRIGAEQYTRTLQGFRNYVVEAIDTVQIISQAVVIRKRETKKIALDKIRSQVEASNDWLNWLRFGLLLRTHGQPLSQSADALRRAIGLKGDALVAYHRLSEILEQMNDFDGAIDVLRQSLVKMTDAGQIAATNARIERISKQASGRR